MSSPSRRQLLKGLGGLPLLGLPAAAAAESAYFEVAVSHSPDVLEPGETSVIEGEITNTGDENDTQIVSVEVSIDGETEEYRESTVNLDPGESETRTEEIEYDEYPEPGDYVGELCSADECTETTWTVAPENDDDPPNEANFTITAVEAASPTAGEPVTVEATIENTGEESDTQTVTLEIPDLGSDETSVTLDGNAETTVELSVSTAEDEGGIYTATVSTADDEASQSVTVSEPEQEPHFEVALEGAMVSMAGENVMVSLSVTNIGSAGGQQTITTSLGDIETVYSSVELDAGETDELDLSIQTSADDAGEYTLTISSDDDEVTEDLTLAEPEGQFEVDIADVTEPMAGTPVTVDTTVTNFGPITDETTLTLDVEGIGSVEESVTVDSDDSTTVSLELETSVDAEGSHPATVSTPDASAETTVDIQPAAAIFHLSFEEISEPTAGDPVEVTVSVSNEGTIEATEDVTVSIEDLGSETESVTVEPDASESVEFAIPTQEEQDGEYQASVEAAGEEATQSVTVAEVQEEEDTQTQDDDDEPADADDDGVGFGVISALAGAGATAAYLLGRGNDEY